MYGIKCLVGSGQAREGLAKKRFGTLGESKRQWTNP